MGELKLFLDMHQRNHMTLPIQFWSEVEAKTLNGVIRLWGDHKVFILQVHSIHGTKLAYLKLIT
jgi:hypothetical protein